MVLHAPLGVPSGQLQSTLPVPGICVLMPSRATPFLPKHEQASHQDAQQPCSARITCMPRPDDSSLSQHPEQQ